MKKRLILILVLLAVVGLTVGGIWYYRRSRTPWRMLRRIDLALQNNDPQQAFELSKNYTGSHPSDPRGWLRQGRSALALSRFDEAQQSFETGLEHDKQVSLYLGAARCILYPARTKIGSPSATQEEIRQGIDKILGNGVQDASDTQFKYASMDAVLDDAMDRARSLQEQESKEEAVAEVLAVRGRAWLVVQRGYQKLQGLTMRQLSAEKTAGNLRQVEILQAQVDQLQEKSRDAGLEAIEALLPVVKEFPAGLMSKELVRAALDMDKAEVLEEISRTFEKTRQAGKKVSAEAETLLLQWRVSRNASQQSVHARKQRIREAIEELRKIEQRDPNAIEPRLRRAEYHMALNGQLEQAQEAVDWVLEKNANHPEARSLKVRILLEQGRNKQAEELAGQLAADEPRSAANHYFYGEALYRTGQIEPALNAMQSAAEMFRFAGDRLNRQAAIQALQFRIRTFLQNERFDVAFSDARKLHSLTPRNPMAILRLVQTAVLVGRGDVARDVLEDSLQSQKKILEEEGSEALSIPILWATWEGYNVLERQESDPELRQRYRDLSKEAAQLAAGATPTNDDMRLQVAKAKLVLGHQTETENIVKELLDQSPEWVDARMLLGDVYERSGRPMLALEQYRKAAEIQPRNLGNLMDLAKLEYRLGLLDPALDRVQTVLEIQPTHVQANLLRGRIQVSQGKEPDWQEAGEEDVGQGGLALAQYLLRKGQYEKARAICLQRLDKHANDRSALWILSQAYLAEGGRENVEEACRKLAEIIETAPDDAGAYLTMVQALGILRDPPLDLDEIRLRFRSVPNASGYRVQKALADLLALQRRSDQAYHEYMALVQRPDVPEWMRGQAALSAGRQLLVSGRTEEGVELLEKLGYAKVDWASSVRSEALFTLAGYYRQVRDRDAMTRTLVEIKALGQKNPRQNKAMLSNVAPLLVAVGEYPKAMEIYSLLADTFPTEAGAERFRAKIEMAAGRYDQAVEALREAIRMQPSDIHSYLMLHELHARRHRPVEALKVLDEMGRIGQAAKVRAAGQKAGFFMRRGLSAQAIDALKDTEQTDLKTRPANQFVLGQSYLRLGKREDARRLLTKIPSHSEFYVPSQLLLTEIPTDVDGRIEAARSVLEENPVQPAFAGRLMTLLMREQRFEEALAVYDGYVQRAGSKKPEASLVGNALAAMLALERNDQARRLARDFATRFASRGWAQRAALLSLPREPADAIKLLPKPEESFGPEVVTGLVAARLLNDAKLIQAFHSRFKSQPEPLRGVLDTLLVSHLMQEPVESLDQLPRFQQAASVGKAALKEYLAFARENAQEGGEAATLLLASAATRMQGMDRYGAFLARQALDKRPGSLVAATLVARGDGRVEALEALLDRMADRDNLVAVEISGRLLHREEEYDKAAQLLRDVLESEPDNQEMRMKLAQSLEAAGALEEALDLYNTVYAASGNPAAANNGAYLVSQLYPKDQQKLTEARKMLADAIPEPARAPSVLDTLGYLALLLKDEKAALEDLRAAVVGLPASIEVHSHLGAAEKLAGNYDLARWHLQAAIDLAQKGRENDDTLNKAEVKALEEAKETLRQIPRS
jgi:tetratricopeptide (TPR) repeat protein